MKKKKDKPLPEVTISESKISDYVDPAIASGVATICPNCKRTVNNTRFCLNCAHQLHPIGWTPPVPLYESLTG